MSSRFAPPGVLRLKGGDDFAQMSPLGHYTSVRVLLFLPQVHRNHSPNRVGGFDEGITRGCHEHLALTRPRKEKSDNPGVL